MISQMEAYVCTYQMVNFNKSRLLYVRNIKGKKKKEKEENKEHSHKDSYLLSKSNIKVRWCITDYIGLQNRFVLDVIVGFRTVYLEEVRQ